QCGVDLLRGQGVDRRSYLLVQHDELVDPAYAAVRESSVELAIEANELVRLAPEGFVVPHALRVLVVVVLGCRWTMSECIARAPGARKDLFAPKGEDSPGARTRTRLGPTGARSGVATRTRFRTACRRTATRRS